MNADFYGAHLVAQETMSFFVSNAEHLEGVSCPPHSHDYGCIHYVQSGIYRERIENVWFEVQPGEILYKPPGIPHSNNFRFTGARTCRIQLQTPKRMGLQLPSSPLKLFDNRLLNLFAQIQIELERTDDVSEMAIEGLSWQIICQLIRKSAGTSKANDCPKIEQATQWLATEFRSPPAIGEMAEFLGIHRSQLARMFKAKNKVTMTEFLRQQRINKAIELLTHTKHSLSSIALECGFVDQSHFTRSFRRVIGTTPANWRRGKR